jgi:hypothetical protein
MHSPTPTAEDAALAKGLAAVIDRALARHPRNETFVYGIHQELAPGVAECLRAHYVDAGWTGVTLREGASGAYLLVLRP